MVPGRFELYVPVDPRGNTLHERSGRSTTGMVARSARSPAEEDVDGAYAAPRTFLVQPVCTAGSSGAAGPFVRCPIMQVIPVRRSQPPVRHRLGARCQ